MRSEVVRIEEAEAITGHLLACLDECYRTLGSLAPLIEDDATVVVVFETARRFGTLTLALREHLAHRGGVDPTISIVPVPLVGEALTDAFTADPSGFVLLFTLSTVVAPKLLVSLRDAGMALNDVNAGPLREELATASGVIVSVLRQIGEFARSRSTADVDLWRATASDLESRFAQAGYGESFGLGRAG